MKRINLILIPNSSSSRSIKTTSGWVRTATATASAPSAASATTWISVLVSSNERRPRRNGAWSSQISTEIGSIVQPSIARVGDSSRTGIGNRA